MWWINSFCLTRLVHLCRMLMIWKLCSVSFPSHMIKYWQENLKACWLTVLGERNPSWYRRQWEGWVVVEAEAESGLVTLHSNLEKETGSEVRLQNLETLPKGPISFSKAPPLKGSIFPVVSPSGDQVFTREIMGTSHTQITTLWEEE